MRCYAFIIRRGNGNGYYNDAEIAINKVGTMDSQNAITLICLGKIYIPNDKYLKGMLLKQLPI